MLNNKIIVVTGGSGRIGTVFLEAIFEASGIAVNADVFEPKEKNNNFIFKKVDINSTDSINNLISDLHNEFGRIDALVNNAYPKNKNYGKKFFDITHNDFNDFLNLHLGGYFNISQSFIKYFLKQGHGNIINISSIQGIGAPAFETYEGTDMHSPIEYTVTKHGLLGMTKYMAKMFRKDNIRVNAISPGGILDKQPEIFLKQYKNRCGMKGMLDSKDLTGALLYLLSDESKFMNGQNLVIDDGFSL